MPSYETIARADFLVAVVLLVILPLALLAGSVSAAAVRNRLLAYWRASALLGITVYLWAGEAPGGFVTGFVAHGAILLALWRGDAFSPQDGSALPSGQGRPGTAFRYWRWAASVYVLIGLVRALLLLPCAAGDATAACRAWYGPPQQYARWVHPTVHPVRLARYGGWALSLYAAYGIAWALWLGWDDFG